jgi:hypothetical protein
MLCGCSSLPASRASVSPAQGTATGNAYRLLLPAGVKITTPDDATAAQLRAVAVNEVEAGAGRTLTIASPLQLVSPAYIANRNATELTLLELLAQLRAENAQLRSK